MKAKFLRMVANITLTCMLVGCLPMMNVNAMDPEVSNSEVVQEQEDNNVNSDVETESVDNNEVKFIANESEAITYGQVNYMYIESPVVTTPGTQRVVVSLNQKIDGAESIGLTVEDHNGNSEEWSLAKELDGLYLFEKEFSESDISETYKIKEIVVKNNAEEKVIDLSSFETEAEFGVNQEYETIDELQPLSEEEAEVETSIVSIDENGVAEAQESISDALDVVSEETIQEVGMYAADFLSGEGRARNREFVVALDPGHDANDAGAQANGLKEEELTLKIANYCKEELEKYSGIKVYMTRTGPACPYNKPGIKCMEDRVQAAANAGARLFVSFHLNASPSAAASGAEVIVPNNNWKEEVGKTGRDLGEKILDELVALGLKRRDVYSKDTTVQEKYPDGSKSDYFSVQIHCKEHGIPGLIVEHAFMTNANDANKFLKTEAGLKKLGIADATGIAKHLGARKGNWEKVGNGYKFKNEDGSYLKNSWLRMGADYYYLNSEGYRLTGWQNIGIFRYYFTDDGVMCTGWQKLNGKEYYFGPSGNMYTGDQVIDGQKYHFGSDGVLGEVKFTGWRKVGSTYYFYDNSGKMVTGWQNIGIFRYYFTSDGKMVTGWQTLGGKKYYFGPSGNMYTGDQVIDGQKYHFGSDGVLGEVKYTGWKLEGSTYYFYDNSGKKVTGWQNIGIFRYYFKSDGKMVTGWQTLDGKKYYFGPSGNMYTGDKVIDGKSYHFGSDGVLKETKYKGWKLVGGTYYFYDDSGKMVTGWKNIGIFRYYFNAEGKMQTGWYKEGNAWYFFGPSGNMYKGWNNIGIFRYYFAEDGKMYTGWQTLNGKKYYFGPSGNMYTGDKVIDGKSYHFGTDGVLKETKYKGWKLVGGTYYFYDDSGKMVTGWQNIGIFRYYFNAEGKMQTGWYKEGETWYFFGPSGNMYKGWNNIGIFRYYFAEDGKMYTGWQTINGKKYYFGPSGNMYTGDKVIDGKSYHFGTDGVLKETKYKGWKLVGGTYYFYDDSGKMVTGWQNIGIFRYYFNTEGKMVTGWQTISGKKYYFGPSGNMYTGDKVIDGKSYHFGSDGVLVEAKYTGWKLEGNTYYFYDASGKMVTGWQNIGIFRYYFTSDGKMVTGWQTLDGKKYYFGPSGNMFIGWKRIDGQVYFFEDNGELNANAKTTAIMGNSNTTVEKMVSMFQKSGRKYPEDIMKKGGAEDIKNFCQIYYEEANAEGVRAEVAFAQAMKETAYLQYGNDVKVEQFNFAGIGATGNGNRGESFPDVRTGIRAHIQHLQAYASTAKLKNAVVDPRYNYVTRGIAPYVEWLGINENPDGKGWATDKKYGYSILKYMNEL